MNKFFYNSEDDYVRMLRFLVHCRMEKSPGFIITSGETYEVTNEGKFIEKTPPIVGEVRSILADLIIRKH